MVGICQCHIPTPIHYDIFPPGGNMTGGNLLGNHDDDGGDDGDGLQAYSHPPYSHQVGICHNE